MEKTMWDDPIFKVILVAIGFLAGVLLTVIMTYLEYGFWLT